MPIRNKWHRLDNPKAIDRIPLKLGAYELGNKNQTIIYIGHAPVSNLRERISDHINSSNVCIKNNAIYFRYETAKNPPTREIKLFCQYKRSHHNQIPPCNTQDPSKDIC